MKKIMILIALLMVGPWSNALSQIKAATETSGIETGTTPGKDIARPGKVIRRFLTPNGYTLTYHLLNLSERGEMVKMGGHHTVIGLNKSPDVTNHLMVYIEKSPGKTLQGDVAFFITGPDRKDFMTMTMGMFGGYGADVIMKLKGTYTIKTKISLESGDAVKLVDEFTFQVT